mgnify:CR=1 FL=1
MLPLRTSILSARAVGACLFLACSLGLTGCATTVARTGRVHQAAAAQLPTIRTTAVVPPAITLNQLTAGGVREQRDDWTQAARAAARESLETMRPENLVYLRDAELPPEIATEIAEVQALYRAVDLNLTLFGNPMVRMPTLAGRFDFSVGSVDRICEAAGADALLLVYGEDDYFTGDRKALIALGFVAAAFTGVYVAPGNGAEHLSAALIARDGTILWYDVLGAGQLGDLRKPEGVKANLENLLRSMPSGDTAPAM